MAKLCLRHLHDVISDVATFAHRAARGASLHATPMQRVYRDIHAGTQHILMADQIVEECGLTHLHVFPFSPREGTPAARMPQLDRALVKERAARLRAVGDAAYARHLASLDGTRQRILIERPGLGRTEGFTLAALEGGQPGQIVEARITGHDGERLTAVAVTQEAA